jgi:Pyridoxamine 5'-phosphate oxidase
MRGRCGRPLQVATGQPIRSWHEFELAAAPISQLARQRFEELGVGLLGTLRRDGSPRVSPIEPYLSHGQLLFGAISWSLKTGDLRRDPRCVLHSAVTSPDAGEAEVKLYGRATGASAEARKDCAAGWWHARPDDEAVVFALGIEQAASIEWSLEDGRMLVRRWSPGHGLVETSRMYP